VAAQVARLEELLRSYQELFAPRAAQLSRFAVEPVVQRAVDLLSFRLRRLGPRFQFERSEPHHGRGAPNAVLHAVINLLTNACDAVEATGGAGRIGVRVLEDPLQIRISDEGCGIPAGMEPRLFSPRFTTKPEGRGTGLGLHIARQAMEHARGTVRLVEAGEARRLPWAKTEFAVEMARD
jgi:signal transduction histidine kinase